MKRLRPPFTKQVFRHCVDALRMMGAGSDLFSEYAILICFMSLFTTTHWSLYIWWLTVRRFFCHRRSSFRRRCLASCSSSMYHGQSGCWVMVLVRSGACLSMSDGSPSLKALTKPSTSPCVVCNMEETTMSCLKASTSMARSFLKETVFCMGTGLASVVVTPTAK